MASRLLLNLLPCSARGFSHHRRSTKSGHDPDDDITAHLRRGFTAVVLLLPVLGIQDRHPGLACGWTAASLITRQSFSNM